MAISVHCGKLRVGRNRIVKRHPFGGVLKIAYPVVYVSSFISIVKHSIFFMSFLNRVNSADVMGKINANALLGSGLGHVKEKIF